MSVGGGVVGGAVVGGGGGGGGGAVVVVVVVTGGRVTGGNVNGGGGGDVGGAAGGGGDVGPTVGAAAVPEPAVEAGARRRRGFFVVDVVGRDRLVRDALDERVVPPPDPLMCPDTRGPEPTWCRDVPLGGEVVAPARADSIGCVVWP